MKKSLSKLFKNLGLVTIPVLSILTTNCASKIDPDVYRVSKEIINTGIRYSTDEITLAKYYFKKVKDRRIYFSFVDNVPYGPGNNDELRMEQEFQDYDFFPGFIRRTIVTDRGLDGKVDSCSGDCEIRESYFFVMINGILNDK
ncbi:MAG: hypothetical protein PVJ67_06620 [Candidatus Pacearchaeota archaeon]|jgi:hypothetical protein